MGTGGGKKITFMLPAVLSSNLTVIVSPNLSLMNDMLKRSSELCVSACIFSSEIPEDQMKEQLSQLESYKLCFCTPEMLAHNEPLKEKMKSLAENNFLKRLVFDECQIISTWGSTFRPVYKNVFENLTKLVNCPNLLLSATLSKAVEDELKETFTDIKVLKQPILRDNLGLHVNERPPGTKLYDRIADFVKSHPNESGIIYSVLPSDVAKLHAELCKRNITCVTYHGQLADDLKHESFDKWLSDQCPVIVANASFGLGIDKANIHYVLHAKVPTSVDEYFQQCGIAGRDGQKSVCVLFYNYSDKNLLYKLFQG